MKLYDIPAEAQEIEVLLTESLGEVTPEMEQRIAAFVAQGKDKIEAAAIVAKSIEAESQFCADEANRLAQRATALKNNADRLKGLILYAVDCGFAGKVKTARFTIWCQTSAPVIELDIQPDGDIQKLDPRFVRIQPELNKQALKDAFKSGEQLPDIVRVVERAGTRYLRIR